MVDGSQWLALALAVLNPAVLLIAVAGGRMADQAAKLPIVGIAAGAVGALTFVPLWSWLAHDPKLPLPAAGVFICYGLVAMAIAGLVYACKARDGKGIPGAG